MSTELPQSHQSIIENSAVQLRLMTNPEPASAGDPSWRLDDETKRVGRLGIAAARDVLRRGTPRYPDRSFGPDSTPGRRAA